MKPSKPAAFATIAALAVALATTACSSESGNDSGAEPTSSSNGNHPRLPT